MTCYILISTEECNDKTCEMNLDCINYEIFMEVEKYLS
jgi:hypothetical protein